MECFIYVYKSREINGPFPARCSLKNLFSKSSRNLALSGTKQNLCQKISESNRARQWKGPNGVKLIIYFRRPCTLLNEQLDFLQLTLISCLKPGRIMENELRVAGKGEWAIDVVDPALISRRV